MKKLYGFMMLLLLVMLLPACGSDDTELTQKTDQHTAAESESIEETDFAEVSPVPETQSYSRKNDIEIPDIQKIMEDIKLQVCLNNWYRMRSVEYPDSWEVDFNEKLYGVPFVIAIYFCDSTYRDGDDCMKIKCVFREEEKEQEDFSLELRYNKQGLMSALYYREEVEDITDYQYLGESNFEMTKEEFESFNGIPQDIAGGEIAMKKIKKALKKLCLDSFKEGTGEVYVEDFLCGDDLVFFAIVNKKENTMIDGAVRVSYDSEGKCYAWIHSVDETIYCGEYADEEEKKTCRGIWKF